MIHSLLLLLLLLLLLIPQTPLARQSGVPAKKRRRRRRRRRICIQDSGPKSLHSMRNSRVCVISRCRNCLNREVASICNLGSYTCRRGGARENLVGD